MAQRIEEELWQQFEQEAEKVYTYDASQINLSADANEALDIFFKKFLDPKEDFPGGSRHRSLEKNFAIYIVQNKIPLEQIKEAYKAKKFNIASLKSQIKGVTNGTYKNPTVNIGEIVNWCHDSGREDLADMIKQKTSNYNESKPNDSIEPLLIESVPEILNKPEKPIRWIIEPFWRVGGISFISSYPGKGKTWLALDAGLSISTGTMFLNKFKANTCKVLYVDYENFDLIRDRLKMLITGKGMQSTSFENLHILSTTKKFKEIISSLTNVIESNGYELLFIDTLREFVEFDENDSTMVSLFIGELRKIIQKTNVHICLLHHEGKGHEKGESLNRLRGSTAFTGAADCVIQINSDGENMILEHTKSKGARSVEAFYCSITQQDDVQYKLTFSGLASELNSNKGIAFFKVWVTDNKIDSFSASEFWEACAIVNISKSTSRRTIAKLALDGQIRKESSKPRAKWIVCRETGTGGNTR